MFRAAKFYMSCSLTYNMSFLHFSTKIMFKGSLAVKFIVFDLIDTIFKRLSKLSQNGIDNIYWCFVCI